MARARAAWRDLRFDPAYVFAGIAVSAGGADRISVVTAPEVTADEATMFRAASVSKIVVGRTLQAVADAAGIADPWDRDASTALGFPLRHPDFADAPVRVGMLASHCAALGEDAGYAVPPDTDLGDWVLTQEGLFAPDTPPGSRFDYSNLGYILLAAVAERWGGAPFGHLARVHVLDPLGIPGGFNWFGVAASERARALPTFRRTVAGLVPQIDAHVPPTGLVLQDAMVVARPGNPAAFSPQGGLRVSLRGMLILAKSLGQTAATPLWRASQGPGGYLDGLFQDYGPGLQILPDPPFYPRPLIGHFGNAYGFHGGIWWDARAEIAFAYALNGVAEGDDSDALSPDERTVFTAIGALAN